MFAAIKTLYSYDLAGILAPRSRAVTSPVSVLNALLAGSNAGGLRYPRWSFFATRDQISDRV
jgi:hypothetical protein